MSALSRPVVDRTGLTGRYNGVMEFIDERQSQSMNPPPHAGGLNFAAALEKATGNEARLQ